MYISFDRFICNLLSKDGTEYMSQYMYISFCNVNMLQMNSVRKNTAKSSLISMFLQETKTFLYKKGYVKTFFRERPGVGEGEAEKIF